MRVNKYSGNCEGCQRRVKAGAGVIERSTGRWLVWHEGCFAGSDNSGYEDRACGDRAYEDQCARAVGYGDDRDFGFDF